MVCVKLMIPYIHNCSKKYIDLYLPGLEKLDALMSKWLREPSTYSPKEMQECLDSWREVLFKHLDEEVNCCYIFTHMLADDAKLPPGRGSVRRKYEEILDTARIRHDPYIVVSWGCTWAVNVVFGILYDYVGLAYIFLL